jgi:peptide/nickel transport system permease protein
MARHLITRLVAIVPTVLLLLLFVVVLIRLLPGNAVDVMLANAAGRQGQRDRQQLSHELGLDKSVVQQFVSYSTAAAHGDLGTSLWTRKRVANIIAGDIGVTVELTVLSLLVGSFAGIGIGVFSALYRGGALDYGLRIFSILGLTVPNFALATIIIVFPTLWWRWSPPLTYTPVSEGLWAHLAQFFTPALILGFGLSAGLMRLTRTTMLDVLRQDYVRTARAKGLAAQTVVVRHALRNALIPVISLFGLQVGALLSGAVVLEQVFGLPGIGRELVSAISQRDYPVIQGITLVAGLFVILTNLLVDMSYGVIDPRIRTA